MAHFSGALVVRVHVGFTLERILFERMRTLKYILNTIFGVGAAKET